MFLHHRYQPLKPRGLLAQVLATARHSDLSVNAFHHSEPIDQPPTQYYACNFFATLETHPAHTPRRQRALWHNQAADTALEYAQTHPFYF